MWKYSLIFSDHSALGGWCGKNHTSFFQFPTDFKSGRPGTFDEWKINLPRWCYKWGLVCCLDVVVMTEVEVLSEDLFKHNTAQPVPASTRPRVRVHSWDNIQRTLHQPAQKTTQLGWDIVDNVMFRKIIMSSTRSDSVPSSQLALNQHMPNTLILCHVQLPPCSSHNIHLRLQFSFPCVFRPPFYLLHGFHKKNFLVTLLKCFLSVCSFRCKWFFIIFLIC